MVFSHSAAGTSATNTVKPWEMNWVVGNEWWVLRNTSRDLHCLYRDILSIQRVL